MKYINYILIFIAILNIGVYSQNKFVEITEGLGVTQTINTGISFVDINNDGFIDIYGCNLNGQNSFLLNIPNMLSFKNIIFDVNIGAEKRSRSAIWADLDNDKDLDMYLCVFWFSNKLYRNDGNLEFTEMAKKANVDLEGLNSYDAAVADFNLDGYLDIYVANFETGQSNKLFYNLGNMKFRDATIYAGVKGKPEQKSRSAVWGDYDNDGYPDLYVNNQGEDVLYHNLGNKKFKDVTIEAGIIDMGDGFGSAWIDYNNDGFLDLYSCNRYSSGFLFENLKDGTFRIVNESVNLPTNRSVMGCCWCDFNNDGFLDLCTISEEGGDKSTCMYFNGPDNIFQDVTERVGLPSDYITGSVAQADINNDGKRDLIFSYKLDTRARLFLNMLDCGNWLDIKLTSLSSPMRGEGTNIQLTVNNKNQYRFVGNNIVGMAQNSMIAHFGLGDNKRVDRIKIVWPDGRIQEFYDIKANRLLSISEENGIENFVDKDFSLAKDFRLVKSHPNPFVSSTNIYYTLRNSTFVKVNIYNIQGQVIRTLSEGFQFSGRHTIKWNGKDNNHHYVSNGVYFLVLEADNNKSMAKLLKLN